MAARKKPAKKQDAGIVAFKGFDPELKCRGYARRSWMESYAIDCEDCDGVTRCICSDDQFSLSREIAEMIKGGK